MIARSAIEVFLNRSLESYDWIKDASEREIDSALASLDPQPDFTTELYLHQKACFYVGACIDTFLFLLDMGTGKTLLSLELIAWRKRRGDLERALVLVPNLISIDSWMDECRKHKPDLRSVPLIGAKDDRKRMAAGDGDVFIINYAGLAAMVGDLKKIPGRRSRKRVADADTMDEIGGLFNCCIMDESSTIKNPNALVSKVTVRVASHCRFRYALTGTPFGRDPFDLWHQFYAVDHGKTLGDTQGLFREAFFRKIKDFWKGFDWKFDKRKQNKLNAVLKNRSIRYDVRECLDLPQQVWIKRKVHFPEETEYYYTRIIDELRETKKGGVAELENIFVRLRQLTSGFLAYKDSETGERHEIGFGDNPKLDALLDLVAALPEDRKMVVFHDFIRSGETISKVLKDIGILHGRLWSGSKERSEILSRFTEGKDRVLVVNNQLGAMVLNLQAANYVVFFETPVSPILRTQAERRCWRAGQTEKVFYYDLVVADSIDEKIIGYLQQGKDLFKALIEGKEKLV